MPSPLVIAQFARLVGRRDLLSCLGLPHDAPLPPLLTDDWQERARALAAKRSTQLAQALLEEAMALDDIQDRDAADRYLLERLEFFASLLDAGTRAAIERRFREVAAGWR